MRIFLVPPGLKLTRKIRDRHAAACASIPKEGAICALNGFRALHRLANGLNRSAVGYFHPRMERETEMNSRYLEAVVVGILTAIVAGFLGIGASRAGSVTAPPATSAPMAADLTSGGH